MRQRLREQLDQKLSPQRLGGVELLTVKELARLLRVSKDTLKNWRKRNEGPIFFRFAGGRIRYPWWGVAVYIAQRLQGAIPASSDSKAISEGQQ